MLYDGIPPPPSVFATEVPSFTSSFFGSVLLPQFDALGKRRRGPQSRNPPPPLEASPSTGSFSSPPFERSLRTDGGWPAEEKRGRGSPFQSLIPLFLLLQQRSGGFFLLGFFQFCQTKAMCLSAVNASFFSCRKCGCGCFSKYTYN